MVEILYTYVYASRNTYKKHLTKYDKKGRNDFKIARKYNFAIEIFLNQE